MRTVVYTSCAANYLAKARVLASSVRSTTEATIVLLLNDEVPEWFDEGSEPFDVVWSPRDLVADGVESWMFQHDLLELCTAVKAPALVRILDEMVPDLVIYLDPDVWVHADLAVIDELLGPASIGLTPHLIRPATSELAVRLTEINALRHGVHNLGFLAVRPTDVGRAFALWWRDRLMDHCVIDFERGLFTDQRWVDLVPAIFDEVAILRDPGLNAAPWNAAERDLRWHPDETWTVDGRPLVFYHFSGVGPSGIHRIMRNKIAPHKPGHARIEFEYERRIAEAGQASIAGWPWAYATFSDGGAISPAQRRAYRELPAQERPEGDPFDRRNLPTELR